MRDEWGKKSLSKLTLTPIRELGVQEADMNGSAWAEVERSATQGCVHEGLWLQKGS